MNKIMYMIILSSRLPKKIISRKSMLAHCPVNAGLYTAFSNIAFHLLPIWQQTLVAIIANQFRIMPDIASKLLHTPIWSCCAVWLESEQAPLSPTGCQCRSELSQFCKSNARVPALFPPACLSLSAATASDLETRCVCAHLCPTGPCCARVLP